MSEKLSESAIEEYEKYRLKETLYEDPSITKKYMTRKYEEADEINKRWDYIVRIYGEGGERENDTGVTPSMGKFIRENFSNNTVLFKYLFEKGHGDAMYYASEEIQDDVDLALLALKSGPYAYRYLSERVRDNDKVFEKATDGWLGNFESASERIRSKTETIEEFVALDARLVNQVPIKKKEEEGFWIEMYRVNKETVKFIPEEKSYIAVSLIESDFKLLNHVPYYLSEKASFWNKMIKIYGKDKVKKRIPHKLTSKY